MANKGKTQIDPHKALESMSADDVLRAMGQAPATDLVGSIADPEPVEAASEVASEPAIEVVEGEDAAEIPAGIDPGIKALLTQMSNIVAVLAAKAAGGGESKAIEALTAAFDRMTAAQVASSNLAIEEQRKAFRPSNQVVPNVSVFNRRGDLLEDYKKPPLKCLMMIPWLVEWAGCTREEVELLNLLEAGSYTVKRADRSKINLEVVIEYKSDRKTPSMLTIRHESAFNNDNFKMMAPLPDFLRDMLKQHDRQIAQQAAAVLTDEEEEAMIEAGELSVSV